MRMAKKKREGSGAGVGGADCVLMKESYCASQPFCTAHLQSGKAVIIQRLVTVRSIYLELFGVFKLSDFNLKAKWKNLCVFANSRVRTTSVPLNVPSLFLISRATL